MDINALEQALSELSGQAYPVDDWKPSHEGSIDIVIKSDGQWFHEGQPFLRDRLVLLFSKILTCNYGYYYLVTPGEKLMITVEDAPFLVVDFEIENIDGLQTVWMLTNIGDRVPLSNEFSIRLDGDEQRPYLTLWRGLDALIERNTYYQLIEQGMENQLNDKTQIIIFSEGSAHNLGTF